jgi:hypothetical protein
MLVVLRTIVEIQSAPSSTTMNNQDMKMALITSLLDEIDFKDQRTIGHKDSHKVRKDITYTHVII